VGPVEDIELKGPEEVAAMKVILLIVALLCMFSTASATEYYVDANTGNDGDDGLSLSDAFLTITYAESQMSNDDILYIKFHVELR